MSMRPVATRRWLIGITAMHSVGALLIAVLDAMDRRKRADWGARSWR